MKKLLCPICKRRLFDMEPTEVETVTIEIKCPCCRNIVKVACTAGENTERILKVTR